MSLPVLLVLFTDWSKLENLNFLFVKKNSASSLIIPDKCWNYLFLFLLGFFEFTLSVKKFNNSSWFFSSKNQNSNTQSNRSKRNTNNQQFNTLWNNSKRQLNTYRGYRFNEFFCDSKDCDVEQYILISALWTKLETTETGSQFDGEAKVQPFAIPTPAKSSTFDFWRI